MCLTDTGINDSMEQAQCLTDSNGALAKSRLHGSSSFMLFRAVSPWLHVNYAFYSPATPPSPKTYLSHSGNHKGLALVSVQ